ncbi:MAG: class I mannose-6-phosphate isomerase [Planctomycetia bacterium]|nr:class I mannose-6-phosphate isomerase [Planctomycetia bacterium]
MLYPLRFFPIYKTAIWGGRTFASIWERELPDEKHIGESWDVSGHAHGMSVVANGPLSGAPLQYLVDHYAEDLLGKHAHYDHFPLLVKFLDANKQLSVQVHPCNRYAIDRQLHDAGKAEAWVVLKAVPGSRLTLGFKRSVTKEQVARALEEERLEDLLFTIEPKVGECFFLPPGMVHSLGAGIFLYEVQQCSNLTLRLYDWNRVDENGNQRELHVAHALETLVTGCWNSTPVTPYKIDGGGENLVESDYFHLDRWTLRDGESARLGGGNRCCVVTLLEGRVRFFNLETNAFDILDPGESLTLPAALGGLDFFSSRHSVLLNAYLP